MDERYAQESQTLRDLLELMHEHDLDRLKVKLGDAVYEIDRRGDASGAAEPRAAAALPVSAGGDAESLTTAGAHVKRVVAPLTGVFYRSPSPDAPAYVEVGSRVETGDVLCVLEAMKLFNEIQSDYSGTIVRIVPGNGELVSQGEELFWVEP